MRMKAGIAALIAFIAIPVWSQEVIDIPTFNLVAGGRVVASGYDSMPYYLYDGDQNGSLFTTQNGELQQNAYIGILRNRRMTIERLLIVGGLALENGGWWDSSSGKPEIQIMANPGADWTTVMTLDAYPTLDGVDMAAAQAGFQELPWEVTFNPPINAVGIRLHGVGATGNNPQQSFVSLSEIRAYGQLRESVNTYDPPPLDGALPIGSNFRHKSEFEGNGHVEGNNLIDGRLGTYVRCEEQGIFDNQAFFGFYSMPITLTSASFIHGPLAESGGWFNLEVGGAPRLEIQKTFGGPWEPAGTVNGYPETDDFTFRDDLPADIETREFTVTLSQPIEAVGIRFIGSGSFNIDETPHIQCAEIMVDAAGTPGYTGMLGTGRDANGQPFKPDANGMFFIEAEQARSVHDAFRIMPHGEANGGLGIRGNFGPTFEGGQFSNQIIEIDIEAPVGDYSVYVQHDIQNGWTDSVYITFDDLDPLTTEGVTNDIRWVPSQGDPPGVPTTLERSLVVIDAGLDFWPLDGGVHTLRIGLREPLKFFDWFLISTDPSIDIANFEEPNTPPPAEVADFHLY